MRVGVHRIGMNEFTDRPLFASLLIVWKILPVVDTNNTHVWKTYLMVAYECRDKVATKCVQDRNLADVSTIKRVFTKNTTLKIPNPFDAINRGY